MFRKVLLMIYIRYILLVWIVCKKCEICMVIMDRVEIGGDIYNIDGNIV